MRCMKDEKRYEARQNLDKKCAVPAVIERFAGLSETLARGPLTDGYDHVEVKKFYVRLHSFKFGVLKHSELEPDCCLAKRNGYAEIFCC